MGRFRLFPLLMALALLLCTVPAAAAEPERLLPKVREAPAFSDIDGTWCQEYVKIVCEAGLMEGVSAIRFDPAGPLTEAQRLVVGVRLHALFHGKTVEQAAPGEAWWLPAARYYLEVNGDTGHQAEDAGALLTGPATRLSFALQMIWSTPAEYLSPVNPITKLPDFDDAALQDVPGNSGFGTEPVLTLYQAGVLNGTDQWGRFDPQATLTRGQAAAVLARIIDPSLRVKFELPEFDLCRDVFQLAPETVLLTVGGTGITLGQLSGRLAQSVMAWPETALTSLESSAVEDVALERLAALRGIPSPPEEQLASEIKQSLRQPGVPDAALKWALLHDVLEAGLAFYYDPALTAFMPGYSSCPEAMKRDLDTVAASLSVTRSPALEALDLEAVRTRLLSSPYCY